MDANAKYDSLIRFYAETFGRDPRQVKRQLWVESRLDPRAQSPVGARGLAQFMPATWSEWGHGDIENPEEAIRACCRYMQRLEEHFGTLELALAAYNWGWGHVERVLAQHASAWVGHLPAETHRYVLEASGLMDCR